MRRKVSGRPLLVVTVAAVVGGCATEPVSELDAGSTSTGNDGGRFFDAGTINDGGRLVDASDQDAPVDDAGDDGGA